MDSKKIETRISYVEYDETLASALAEMWNESSDCWNGFVSRETAQSVAKTEKTSPHLKLWLALDGKKVVGYCKLQQYAYDSDTLYIRLLNAHPAYHGYGIGKELVLRCVRETIKLGVPRLDLYTWAGNTKAVPLYKKCGFFWDSETEYTHLMNFLPGFITSPLGKKLLAEMDWYADSARVIEIKPDCFESEGHILYSYIWKKGSSFVKATYEHFGRGLVALETDRWSVKLRASADKTVFGQEHPFSIEVESQGDKPVCINVDGVSDRNIACKFKCDAEITGRKVFEGTYFAGEIEKEQDSHRTYPRLSLRVSVDGHDALFSLGRRVAFPASLSLSRPEVLASLGADPGIVLSAENNSNAPSRCVFSFPHSEELELDRDELALDLEPMGKASIKIPAVLKQGTFWSPLVQVTSITAAGTRKWTRKLGLQIHAPGAVLEGETDSYSWIGAGRYRAKLELAEDLNWLMLGEYGKDTLVGFQEPSVGKPFTQEFNASLPKKIERSVNNGGASMKMHYSSADKGLEFSRNISITPDGFFEHYYAFRPETVPGDTRIGFDFWMEWENFILPYDGKIVVAGIDDNIEWESDKIDGNWLAFKKDGRYVALTWDTGSRLEIAGWKTRFEWDVAALAARGMARTPTVRVLMGTMHTLEEIQDYAACGMAEPRSVMGGIDAWPSADMGYIAFAGDLSPTIHASVVDTAAPVSLSVTGDAGYAYSVRWTPEQTDNGDDDEEADSGNAESSGAANSAEEAETSTAPIVSGYSDEFEKPSNARVELLTFKVEKENTGTVMRRVIFRPDRTGEVSLKKEDNSLRVDNGVLSFAADNDFYYGLYSLKYEGREWLHSGYPARENRSWYTEWAGGLHGFIYPIYSNGTLKEPRTMAFCEKADDDGLLWRGIETTVSVEHNEKVCGLILHLRYLTLPGLPLLKFEACVENKRGVPMDVELFRIAYLHPGTERGARLYIAPGCEKWINGFAEEAIDEIFETRLAKLESPERKEKLYVYCSASRDFEQVEANTDPKILRMDAIRKLRVEAGYTATFAPDYVLFTERDLVQDDFILLDRNNR